MLLGPLTKIPLSSYGRRMICHTPFLVGAGPIPQSQMRRVSHALAKAWEKELIHYSSFDSPIKVLTSLNKENALVALWGDGAAFHSEGISWIEALGSWKKPLVLFASPDQNGTIPGTVPAYIALCRSFAVPFLGVVQLGGDWDVVNRRKDGIPWSGWLPKDSNNDLNSLSFELLVEDIARKLDFKLTILQ